MDRCAARTERSRKRATMTDRQLLATCLALPLVGALLGALVEALRLWWEA